MTDTKYKTEATERKAPEISVCAHVAATTEFQVYGTDETDTVINVKGWDYPTVTLFMKREKLAEMRDAITSYLDGSQ